MIRAFASPQTRIDPLKRKESPMKRRALSLLAATLAAAITLAFLAGCSSGKRDGASERLVASGVDLRTVQELMGHADIKTTMIYAHVVEGNKHAAIARLHKYEENCHEITTASVIELDARRA
jgi:hypothetical protein